MLAYAIKRRHRPITVQNIYSPNCIPVKKYVGLNYLLSWTQACLRLFGISTCLLAADFSEPLSPSSWIFSGTELVFSSPFSVDEKPLLVIWSVVYSNNRCRSSSTAYHIVPFHSIRSLRCFFAVGCCGWLYVGAYAFGLPLFRLSTTRAVLANKFKPDI